MHPVLNSPTDHDQGERGKKKTGAKIFLYTVHCMQAYISNGNTTLDNEYTENHLTLPMCGTT